MMDLLLFAFGLIGFGLAGYYDLKTSEFSEWIPYGLIISALVIRGVFSFITGDLLAIANSVIFGVAFLALGFALYFLKQWGDGDAWLMGALGFLFPVQPTLFATAKFGLIPFQLGLIFNFFIVAFIYIIIYMAVLGLRKPEIKGLFFRSLRKNAAHLIALATAVFIFYCGAAIYMAYSAFSFSPYIFLMAPAAIVLIAVIFLFGRTVEGKMFRKKISAKKLKVGDVLAGKRWRGLTEKEVKALKKKGGSVWIKDGIRFTPVFVIALIITAVFGNIFLWMV